MTFENPQAFWWFALFVPVLLLHFWHRRSEHDVGASMIWKRALARRTLWQRWRRHVSLAMQLLLVTLLVLAAAQPFWGSRRDIVLILDVSASMSARDDAFSAAKSAAAELVDRFAERDHVAIVSSGSVAHLECALTPHARSLHAALEKVSPTAGPTRVNEALRVARNLLSDDRESLIVLLTDARVPNELDTTQVDLYVLRFGERGSNLGIVTSEVRRTMASPREQELLVRVANFSDEEAACNLELDVPGQDVAAIPVSLSPQAAFDYIAALNDTPKGLVALRLTAADNLLADNQTLHAVAPADVLRVRLLSDDRTLADALAALPLVELSETDDAAVTVIYKQVTEPLPDGPLLLIHPEQSSPLWTIDGPLLNAGIAFARSDSPLLANTDFRNTIFEESMSLQVHCDHEVLAATRNDVPLYFACEVDGRRMLVLNTRLESSDLPLRHTFREFLLNAIRWLSRSDSMFSRSPTTADIVKLDGYRQRVLMPPNGSKLRLPDDQPTLQAIDAVGLWKVQRADAANDVADWSLPSNLVDARESNLEIPDSSTTTMDLIPSGGFPCWPYFVWIGLCVAFSNWHLIQRRILE